MSSAQGFQAVTRFGLSAKPGELEKVSSDPKGWLRAQLKNPKIPVLVKERVGGELSLKQLRDAQKVKPKEATDKLLSIRQLYIAETGNRFITHVNSDQPFIERLVMFWSNHFTISIQKPLLAGIVNRYEVEAIRPFAAGYFKDLLISAVKHPGMTFYLDNMQSFGPNSRAGLKREKGLNENLAREILELHTLGVDGGYTQNDVIALAKIITGWSLKRNNDKEQMVEFDFLPQIHEPGDKVLLGKTFRENGEQEGIDALTMLANHPATAKHIATKLARHFISDKPSEVSIKILTDTYLKSGGHIATVMNKLIDIDEAWKPLTKVKNSYEFVVSAFRAINIQPDAKQAIVLLEALNYRPFNATSPAGYSDFSDDWVSPDSVMKRIEWAHKLSQRLQDDADPLQIAQGVIGPILTEGTANTIKRAASGKDGFAFFLASPEFQRR